MGTRTSSAGPRMCPNCHSIVSAGESSCPQCSVSLGQRPVVHAQNEGAGGRFVNAVLARPSPFTIAIIAFCIILYLLMRMTGGLETAALVAFGAKLNSRVNAGEWWRLVTPIFLHVPGGALPLHLLVNMYSLWNIGPYVEKLYGSSKFVVIWVVTGIAGVLASYLCVRPGMSVGTVGRFLIKSSDNPSAGASGALFGLVGVLIVFGIKYRRELPEGFKRAFGTGLLPILAINFFIGFVGSGFIDNAAHIGGLLSGVVLAVVVDYDRPGSTPFMQNLWRVLQIAAIALVAVSFIMLSRHYAAPPSEVTVQTYLEAINGGQSALVELINSGDSTKLEPAERALANAPQVSTGANELAEQLRVLVQRATTLKGVTDSAGKTTVPEADRVTIAKEFSEWGTRFRQWTEGEGAIFRIVLTPAKETTGKPGT
ncbi:MAG: rhomboid family intramembrane serine protease [Pyrinomonadaceae bacterium]